MTWPQVHGKNQSAVNFNKNKKENVVTEPHLPHLWTMFMILIKENTDLTPKNPKTLLGREGCVSGGGYKKTSPNVQ